MTDRSVVYRLRAELGQFRAQMAQASASTRKVANDLTGLTKEGEKSRKGLASLGSVGGKIGLVAAAGLGAAVIKAADFDKSMSNVQAATRESAANMDRLREAALQAGADTAFSATEASDAIKELAFAGIATEDILAGGLDGALSLAAAGSLDVGDAASFAASAMNQFKLSGEDIPHVADLFAAAAGNASGEVSDYGGALNQAGLVASQFGLTLEETMGTLAAMGSTGFVGSDAGTSLKTFLQALVPASDQAQSAMEDMGFSAFDAQGNFVGMADVAQQLSEGLSEMTQQQQNATLKTIFGADAVRAAGLIYQQGGKGMQEWIDKTDDAGFAADVAATKMDNLAGDWEELTGSIETALIGTGEGAQGPLRSLVQGATDLVNVFNELSPTSKKVASGLLGITAVLGGGLWFTSKTVHGVANTRTALENLGVSSDKSSRAMRGVAKAGLALAGFEVAIAGLGALQSAMAETLPGTEALTGRLLDLSHSQAADLGQEFDSLGESIDRMFDEGRINHAGDALISVLTIGQLEGRHKSAARAEVEALDAALANLAGSAGPEAASAALRDLAEAQDLSRDQVDLLTANLPQYDEAMAGAANQTKIAEGATDDLAGAAKGAAGAVGELTTMTEGEAKALKKSREAAADTAHEFFGLGDKVDKAKVSLGEWLRDLEKQATALREFQRNAKEAGKRGLDQGLITSLEEAGTAGALRMRQLANATDAEIERANRAWRRGERAVNDYTDAVGGVPPADLYVNNKPALIGIKEVQKRLGDLKDKTLTIRVTASGTAALSPGFGPQSGFASGGWTGPGGKYQPAGVVHGDEYVFSKEATHGNVAMLERLHRQLRGYASGGLVQRHAAPVSMGGGSVDIDYQRLASALSTMRPPAPLYGDVHVSDGYGGFKRQMLADRQAAGLGGV